MAIPEEYSEYMAARDGTVAEPAEVRWSELTPHVAGLYGVVSKCVGLIYESKLWVRAPNNPKGLSAWEWIEQNVTVNIPAEIPRKQRSRFKNHVECALMRLVLDVAKVSVQYWGVQDPMTEGYCSHCKRARPLSEFSTSMVTCTSCGLNRKRGGRE